MKWTLANVVTFIRLLLVPLFFLFLGLDSGGRWLAGPGYFRWAAVAVFFLLFILDWADGYLARARNEVTLLGKTLDPLVDKIFILSSLIYFSDLLRPAASMAVPRWYLMSVALRDLLLAAGVFALYFEHRKVFIRSSLLGKWATFLQMTVIGFLLLKFPVPWFQSALFVSAAFTGLSFAHYLLDALGRQKFFS